jgi:hypothetical protein
MGTKLPVFRVRSRHDSKTIAEGEWRVPSLTRYQILRAAVTADGAGNAGKPAFHGPSFDGREAPSNRTASRLPSPQTLPDCPHGRPRRARSSRDDRRYDSMIVGQCGLGPRYPSHYPGRNAP